MEIAFARLAAQVVGDGVVIISAAGGGAAARLAAAGAADLDQVP
jgi:hypothetical protein